MARFIPMAPVRSMVTILVRFAQSAPARTPTCGVAQLHRQPALLQSSAHRRLGSCAGWRIELHDMTADEENQSQFPMHSSNARLYEGQRYFCDSDVFRICEGRDCGNGGTSSTNS
ncbi:hypothetical protein B0H10DRAFT_2023380 [Mycena sp. CBHHK59/15]|nr:hypothetical protein B0H10DRAFT_2023380 [Mycena sp. CBHHK59/15]